eukprot:1157218-Pelagomonas_calceolata.AAC.24
MASCLAVCCGTHADIFFSCKGTSCGVYEEGCVNRSLQSVIAAQLPMECVTGVTEHVEKGFWLEGRLRNGGAQSENKICLAAEKVA